MAVVGPHPFRSILEEFMLAIFGSRLGKGWIAVLALALLLGSCDLLPGFGPAADSNDEQNQMGPQLPPQLITRVMTTLDELTYAECSTETLQIHAFFNPDWPELTSVILRYRYAQPSTDASSDWFEIPMEPNGNVVGQDRYTFTLNDMAEHQGILNGGEGRLEYRIIADDALGVTTTYPEQEHHYNALLIRPCPTETAQILRVERSADVVYYPDTCQPHTVDLDLIISNPDLVSAIKIEFRYRTEDTVYSGWFEGLMQYVGFSSNEGLFRFTIDTIEAESLLSGNAAQIEYRFIVFTADESFTWPSSEEEQTILINVESCSANTPIPTYELFPTQEPGEATPTSTPQLDS
jgi:hypothetical protein